MVSYQGGEGGTGSQRGCGLQWVASRRGRGEGSSACVRCPAFFNLPPSTPPNPLTDGVPGV